MSEIEGLTNEEAKRYLKSPDATTTEFIMQQTMYRIKDPRKTLEFYSGVLGMRLLKKLDFPEMQFSIYFMGFEKEEDFPKDKDKLIEWVLTRRATIELCHNWGSESDPELKYHNGNSDPRGFGHIGISVPDVDAACKRFETLNVEFTKKPNDGKMKGIAFIKDPDGYLIEIFDVQGLKKLIK